jgi:hypothetical protein
MKFFLTSILLGITLLPTSVMAQNFLVGIPGIGSPTGDFDGYINAIYAMFISIAALLAVVKIVIAGVKYMFSDIVTQKSEAKKDIQGAIFGLVLILGAVLILTVINPDLTNFNLEQNQIPLPEPIADTGGTRLQNVIGQIAEVTERRESIVDSETFACTICRTDRNGATACELRTSDCRPAANQCQQDRGTPEVVVDDNLVLCTYNESTLIPCGTRTITNNNRRNNSGEASTNTVQDCSVAENTCEAIGPGYQALNADSTIASGNVVCRPPGIETRTEVFECSSSQVTSTGRGRTQITQTVYDCTEARNANCLDVGGLIINGTPSTRTCRLPAN